MSDIFISYSSKDRERAKVLAGALERQGWSVWWDRKIPPGKQFSKVIKEAMDEARCVIVLWSKDSVKSEWVQNEASEGAQRKILVPALIDDVEIPFEFRRIQAARLVDWEGRSPHPEFDILLEALCAILGQPLLPQASEPTTDEQQPVNEIQTLPKDKPKEDRPKDTTIKEPKKLQTTKVLAGICIIALIVIVSIVVFLKYRQPKTYSLTTTAVDGKVTKDPNQASYNHGEKVTLEAVPNKWYSFTNWSGDLCGSTNPAKLIMDADKAVIACFEGKAGDVKTYTGRSHSSFTEFRDGEDVISKGPITWVKVNHGGYINGLQLGYGGHEGKRHGFCDESFGLKFERFDVPPGQRIKRVKIAIAGDYVSQLQFVTDKGKESIRFGGNKTTPIKTFTAEDKNGLPLRTISGWVNLRRHESLSRAITEITFHFGN